MVPIENAINFILLMNESGLLSWVVISQHRRWDNKPNIVEMEFVGSLTSGQSWLHLLPPPSLRVVILVPIFN